MRTALNEPNAMVKNLVHISQQFEKGQFISVSLFDHEQREIVSLLHVRGQSDLSADETLSDIIAMIGSVMEKDVGGLALVVFNEAEGYAELTALALFSASELDPYPLFAVLYTDGVTWKDLSSEDEAAIDYSEITDFELRNMVENDNITPYTGLDGSNR